MSKTQTVTSPIMEISLVLLFLKMLFICLFGSKIFQYYFQEVFSSRVHLNQHILQVQYILLAFFQKSTVAKLFVKSIKPANIFISTEPSLYQCNPVCLFVPLNICFDYFCCHFLSYRTLLCLFPRKKSLVAIPCPSPRRD